MKRFPQSDDPWVQDVWLLARRMALLYYYMATAIVDRLGEDEGKKLVRDAVWAYGEACGRRVRDGVLSQGLPLDAGNYARVPDLPSKGWSGGTVALPSGEKAHATTFCPLAATWKELGAEKLGRLYCLVDQAKYCAYAPDLRLEHTRNLLDGDDCCVMEVTERK